MMSRARTDMMKNNSHILSVWSADMRYKKSYTVKEWKRFDISVQELLCKRYKITLTDHKNKFKAGKMVKVPLKEKLKTLPSKITMPNINKGIDTFNKSVQEFGKSMDKVTGELGGNKKQQIPLWSEKKKDVKIWGEKKVFGNWKAQPKRKKRKTKTQDQKNLEKLWGKRR